MYHLKCHEKGYPMVKFSKAMTKTIEIKNPKKPETNLNHGINQ